MTARQLPRLSPESQGITSKAISRFIEAAEAVNIELHSMMLLRHGHVVAEGWWHPYSADRIHLLYSLSKSFTSTAIGMAVDEGLLTVDDLVTSFFPDKLPETMSSHFQTMRVHHLLSMGTGHAEDALGPMTEQNHEDWVAAFFLVPPDQEPGSIFAYNNAATFMLSAIVQKLTGMTVNDYLRPRLYEPLGIEQAVWHNGPGGVNLGFSGLHITTEAIAKFGQLYLQKGEWQGQQLIPQSWVETATAYHIDNRGPDDDASSDWAQGYGYQFWQCRHGAYRGDGAFGQFCVIMPDQDAVFVTTAGHADMQEILDLFWDHLLPAMGKSPLPENISANQALTNQLAQLAYTPPQGESTSAMVATVTGQTYEFSFTPGRYELHAITFHLYETYAECVVVDDYGEHQLSCGYNEWWLGETTLYAPGNVPAYAGAAWTAPNVLSVAMRLIESPHAVLVHFRFDEDRVSVSGRWNVQFGQVEVPPAEGRLKIG